MELLFEKYWLNNIIWSRPLKKILLSIVRVYVQYSPFINNFFLVSEFDIQFLHDLPKFFPWFMKRQRDIRLFEMLLSSKLFRFSFYIKMIFFFKFGVHKEMLQIIHDTTNIGTLKGIFIAISHQIHQQHIHKHTYSVINNYMSYYIYYITFLSQKICICEKTIQYILYIIQWIKKKSTKVCNLELALPLVVRCKWINAKAK